MTTRSAPNSALCSLFVYGTLRPGDRRWHLLAPFVLDEGSEETVEGSLFDTGCNYPAAIFGKTGVIRGRIYTLCAESSADCLMLLDAEEASVDGDYTRVAIKTSNGSTAWAYEYGGGLELTLIRSGDWFDR